MDYRLTVTVDGPNARGHHEAVAQIDGATVAEVIAEDFADAFDEALTKARAILSRRQEMHRRAGLTPKED